MKAAAFLLCLLVATAAEAEPAYRIREVRFAGDPAFEPDALRKVIEDLRIRRVIPGIWTRRPLYDASAVDADIVRLRSFYFSHGYFDANIGVADVTFDEHEATITLDVRSGPKTSIRQVKIEGLVDEREKIITSANGDFPVDTVCKCLLDAARNAETHGRIDFSAELEVAPRNSLDVTVRVQPGTAHAVGRINFSGHYKINESTLRRMMTLQEQALFDVGHLRRSLARLNLSGLFQPLTMDDVAIQQHADGVTVDLTISLRERSRARWSLSGPVVPFGGRLQAAISSRLPGWGRGFFEASTYSVTLSLIGMANPFVRLLPLAPKAIPSLSLFIERPYLPGRAPFSGFAISPKLPVRTLLTSYGLTHLGVAARAALEGETLDASGLLVPVKASADDAGLRNGRFLICDPPKPRLWWLRRGSMLAADMALGAFGPFAW